MAAEATYLDHDVIIRHDLMTELIFGHRAELFPVATAGD